MSDSRNKEHNEPIGIDRGARSAARPADAGGASDERAAEGEAARETAIAEQIARLEAEKNELTQTLIRRQADFENYRKRVEKERHEEHRRGTARLMEDLLPVLDAFERALSAHAEAGFEEMRKGVELIYRQLWDALARHGLERIDAAGKPFDPHFHHAIARVETREFPDGSVVEVLQDGFLFHGRVLRPSVVKVAVHNDEAGPDGSPAAHRHAG